MARDDWDEQTTATGIDLTAVEAIARGAACVTILAGSATGTIFKLAPGNNVIGRAPDAQLRILDDGMSRHHASITVDGDSATLADLASRNGTFLNSKRVEAPTTLAVGDKIQIGRNTVMRYALHDELDESFHENLLSSALRDPLTKLFNKRYLMDRLDAELKFAKRHDTALSVLMLDLDHFKTINDSYGHLAGDAVLVKLAALLARAVRNEDVVARFGGEELAIVLRAIPLELARTLGERLRRLVEATPIEHQGRELRVTVSIGIASFPATTVDTVEQLLDTADRALYRAKDGGRNRVVG